MLLIKKYPFHTLFASMYLAGMFGLNIECVQPFFYFFTPIHLVAALVVVLFFHEDKNRNFIVFCVSTFLIGFFIEMLGVNTGLIFGRYQYNTTLGFKIAGTPPVIGVLWLLLAYCFGVLIDSLSFSKPLKIIIGATAMTLLDVITEPIAIRHKMWSWFGQNPPFQNYVGWFLVSFLVFGLFFNLNFKKKNAIAGWILLLNTLFFAGQYLLG